MPAMQRSTAWWALVATALRCATAATAAAVAARAPVEPVVTWCSEPVMPGVRVTARGARHAFNLARHVQHMALPKAHATRAHAVSGERAAECGGHAQRHCDSDARGWQRPSSEG